MIKEQNKEKCSARIKKYYQENKELVSQKAKLKRIAQNDKYNCECGGRYTLNNKRAHEKTKRHLKYV